MKLCSFLFLVLVTVLLSAATHAESKFTVECGEAKGVRFDVTAMGRSPTNQLARDATFFSPSILLRRIRLR